MERFEKSNQPAAVETSTACLVFSARVEGHELQCPNISPAVENERLVCAAPCHRKVAEWFVIQAVNHD